MNRIIPISPHAVLIRVKHPDFHYVVSYRNSELSEPTDFAFIRSEIEQSLRQLNLYPQIILFDHPNRSIHDYNHLIWCEWDGKRLSDRGFFAHLKGRHKRQIKRLLAKAESYGYFA